MLKIQNVYLEVVLNDFVEVRVHFLHADPDVESDQEVQLQVLHPYQGHLQLPFGVVVVQRQLLAVVGFTHHVGVMEEESGGRADAPHRPLSLVQH